MTYYLKQSDWLHSEVIPEGMNLDMINQPDRLSTLLKPAINLIEPDKIFIDLGCGTGILGLHALTKGAKFVYFVEQDVQMFHILTNILPNKIDPTRFKLINKDIEHLSLEDFDAGIPDIVVSEFYGPRLFDEGYVNYTRHVKSLFPKCFFIPETFVGKYYLADVDPTQSIWPIDSDLLDHYKFMYKHKGFAKAIDFPKNEKFIGEIRFNANTQEFNKSFDFDFSYTTEKMLYGHMDIEHLKLTHHYTSMGWYMDSTSYNKNYKLYFDSENYFNPRLIENTDAK